MLEGPKIVEDALRRDAVFDAIFLGPNARTAFRDLLELAAVEDVAGLRSEGRRPREARLDPHARSR